MISTCRKSMKLMRCSPACSRSAYAHWREVSDVVTRKLLSLDIDITPEAYMHDLRALDARNWRVGEARDQTTKAVNGDSTQTPEAHMHDLRARDARKWRVGEARYQTRQTVNGENTRTTYSRCSQLSILPIAALL